MLSTLSTEYSFPLHSNVVPSVEYVMEFADMGTLVSSPSCQMRICCCAPAVIAAISSNGIAAILFTSSKFFCL